MRKLLTTLLIAALVACYSIVPVSAGTIDGTATLTITPSITTAVAGTDAVEVTYTIKLTPPTGKAIGVFSFHLTAPTGETLPTDFFDSSNNTLIAYVDEDNMRYSSSKKTGIFTTYDYTPEESFFAASGTTETRRMTSEAQIMTIKATIAAGQVGSFALGAADFKAGLDGSGDFYTCEVKSTPVVVTGSLSGSQAVTIGTAPAIGAATSTVAATGTNFTAAFTNWKQGSTAVTSFDPNKTYTATCTLTPAANYKFASGAAAAIADSTSGSAGTSTVASDGSSLSFTYTFATPALPALTGSVGITGTEKYGETLTATPAATPSDATLAYQWYRDTEAISGATGSTYTVAEADINKTLKVTVTDTANKYSGSLEATTGTIAKADYSGTAVSAPAATKTATTITVTSPVDGQEYAVSTTGTAPTSASDWNTTGQFTSLMANTAYHVFTRVKETSTTLASASESSTITTDKLVQTITVPSVQQLTVNKTLDLSTLCSSDASGATLTYTIEAGTTGTTISGSTLTAGATVGEVTVTVNSAAVGAYDAAVGKTFTVSIVAKLTQAITASNVTATYGDTGKSVSATGTHGTVTYAVKSGTSAAVNSSTGALTINGAGDTVITISAAGDADYAAATKDVTVTVSPKTLSKSDLQYTGSAITKTYDGGFTCSLTAVSVKPASLVGSDTLAITGAAVYNSKDVASANKVTFTPAAITSGNYRLAATETIDINAAITQKTLTGTMVGTIVAQTYTGSQLKPEITVLDAAGITANDYTLSYGENINSGTDAGSITVTAKNNYTGSFTRNFTIVKAAAKTLADINVELKYTNTSEQTVDVSKLVPGSSNYTAVAGANSILDSYAVNAGIVSFKLKSSGPAAGNTATITVTIKSANYEDSTVAINITLIAKDVPTATANNITKTYDGNPVAASAITGTSSVPGTWSFKGTPALTNVSDSGTKTVVFTPTDSTNYAAVEKDITVTINKAKPAGTPSFTAINASGKTLDAAALSVGTITPAGTIEWDAGASTTAEANKAYGWTFAPNDTANYTTLTGTLTPYTVYSGGGVIAPTVQKPVISAGEGGKTALSEDGTNLTITPDEGYEIKSVTLNGVEQGAKTSLTGLKTGDKVTVTFEKKASETPLIDSIHAAKVVYPNATVVKAGKIKLTWLLTKETNVDYFEIFRSDSAKGPFKKFFITKNGDARAYWNNLNVKSGHTYYYKVRGVKLVDGVKVYTKISSIESVTAK